MRHYDVLCVGAGLFSAVVAEQALQRGKSVLVLEKRDHIAGNIYTEKVQGIDVHRYGAHIFHTSNKNIWDYAGQFAEFNHFINEPIANYHGEIYNLPFNMNTFAQMFHIATPQEAQAVLDNERGEVTGEPQNLEEQAIKLVGRTVYTKLVKGYTEKQWGRSCKDLPPFIIRRLPVRMTYDNNYFNDRFQGIPVEGYTAMVENMLRGADVQTGIDFLADKDKWLSAADTVVYTGPIDAYFGWSLGKLEYRSLRFETELLDTDNFQGNAVVNYTAREVPYTRIIEHKHFTFGDQPVTVVTREYPAEWQEGMEPYYPVKDEKNDTLYQKYRELAKDTGVYFGGRLGQYRYYDMDDTIEAALALSKTIL
ncbi:MAG: UDP-galactopyranose mutase [Acutalibacteraceae bacterium]|nr:UDP-galactopyranose mutase [Acutalibacteraceae bacterium]